MFTVGNLERLECKTNSSCKYYEVEIRESTETMYPYEIWLHWGRIGNNGKWQYKDKFTTRPSAVNFARQIVKQKLAKGYKRIDPGQKNTPAIPDKPKVDKKYARFVALLE